MSETLSPEQLAKEAQQAYKRGDYLDAAQGFEAAAQGYQFREDSLSVAEMYNNSSVAYLQAGDGASALRVVQGTAEIFSISGDILRYGMALGNLGAALEAVGRLDEATEAYQQSAELLKQADETEMRARVMQSLSAIQLKTGHQLEALASMQAGLDGLKKPSPKQRVLRKLLNLPSKLIKGS
jgi:tetratricopeptide (TPR) repeat protein